MVPAAAVKLLIKGGAGVEMTDEPQIEPAHAVIVAKAPGATAYATP
jgi:hypothetical protein